MQFTIAIISAIAAVASATPLATRQVLEVADFPKAASDSAQIVGPVIQATFSNLRFFENSGFGGAGVTISGQTGSCFNVGSDWNDRVSSIQNQSQFTCTVWMDANCSGNSVTFPRQTQLESMGSNNDRVSSYKCT